MSPTKELPSFPFAREYGYHPPSLNAKLRHECPISQVQLYDGNPAWILTKHKHCCDALASEKLSADRRAHGFPEIHEGGKKAKDAEKPMFVNLDNPEHDQQRALLESEFTSEAVETKWRPMMERTVDDLLEEFIKKGEGNQPIDLVKDFAVLVPTRIIYRALGVPEKDVERLSEDSEVRNSTSRNAAESANTQLREYMRGLVQEKIRQPGGSDDIIGTLVAHHRQNRLAEEDIVTLAFLVLTAGNAALISSISVGTLILLEHRDQRDEFVREPERLVGSVVTEITRYHTASALNSRRAVREEVEIGGRRFRPGEGVICSVQSADRDEDKFGADAERFDIHRPTAFGDSLGFGYGPHRCQAAEFSKTQLEIVFAKLFARLPKLRLAEDPSTLQYTPATMNAGVAELPVYFE